MSSVDFAEKGAMAVARDDSRPDGSYAPVRTSGAYEAVVRQLEQQVTSGKLPPGARLPSITELARAFGVSVPVVREAVMSLRARGLLDVRHGSGTFVAEPPERETPTPSALPRPTTVADLLALLEVRLPLEVHAAELAAAAADKGPLVALDAAVAAMARAHQAGDAAAFLTAYVSFHLGLAEASGNAYLPMVLAPILDLLTEPVPGAPTPARAPGILHHRALVAALRDGNTDMAALVMRQHLGTYGHSLKAAAPPV